MKPKETIEKAYGHVPKEVGIFYDLHLDWLRGFKYYWLKFVRLIKGR